LPDNHEALQNTLAAQTAGENTGRFADRS